MQYYNTHYNNKLLNVPQTTIKNSVWHLTTCKILPNKQQTRYLGNMLSAYSLSKIHLRKTIF